LESTASCGPSQCSATVESLWVTESTGRPIGLTTPTTPATAVLPVEGATHRALLTLPQLMVSAYKKLRPAPLLLPARSRCRFCSRTSSNASTSASRATCLLPTPLARTELSSIQTTNSLACRRKTKTTNSLKYSTNSLQNSSNKLKCRIDFFNSKSKLEKLARVQVD